eukprot:NODE_30229_length_424_cov_1.531987.p1 GENE.NODE_30229_length_424_cov_1.531987~~NODE_30229_length_424_cov_1.531987.p1  ORF type:complete len:124 (-),score=40.99 NODE_30229_length_424_cov_1.531987:53-370(-)
MASPFGAFYDCPPLATMLEAAQRQQRTWKINAITVSTCDGRGRGRPAMRTARVAQAASTYKTQVQQGTCKQPKVTATNRVKKKKKKKKTRACPLKKKNDNKKKKK